MRKYNYRNEKELIVEKIELEILGLSSSLSTSNSTYALILKEVHGNRRLPVIIGAFEAQAIALELEKFKRLRPLTHDIFYETILKLDASIQYIIIDDIKEGIFYATIYIRQKNGNIIELDARPSDAVAMAVRFNCPIYTNSKVMDEASVVVNEEEFEENDIIETENRTSTSAQQTNIESLSNEEILQRIQTLNAEIEEAILHEDYEKAAKLRDEIKQLESKKNKNS